MLNLANHHYTMEPEANGSGADAAPSSLRGQRERRRQVFLGSVLVSPETCLADERPWLAIVSSRLGRDASHHQLVSQFLSRAMLDCQARSAVAIIAVDSAIETLALHAASLFRVPVIRVAIAENKGNKGNKSQPPDILVSSGDSNTIGRDQAVIALADRVEVLSLRRGGTIERVLTQRLQQFPDSMIQVAINSADQQAVHSLIAKGAVGWYLSERIADDCSLEERSSDERSSDERSPASVEKNRKLKTSDAWMQTSDRWLVHCTRAPCGPWPGETEQQFRDDVLLGTAGNGRTAFDALSRIARSKKLVASCRTTDRRWPVVCFSSRSLQGLMESRCFRSHLKRWDYEPYGIAIRIEVAQQLGARSVVYGTPDQRERIELVDRYLFQAAGKTFDWTTEREWRMLGDVDLSAINQQDAYLFTASDQEAECLRPLCPWQVTAVFG